MKEETEKTASQLAEQTTGVNPVDVVVSGKKKKITINNKLLGKIRYAISFGMQLDDISEFENSQGASGFFDEPPVSWTPFENDMCDYQNRIQDQIFERIKKLLLEGNSR